MTTEKEFLDLLEQHKNVLYKVSRMYMDTPDDRDDLIQEMTFQLWKAYSTFAGNSKFSTWMYRVALNTAITFFKKQKRKIDGHPLTREMDRADDDRLELLTREEQLDYFYEAVRYLSRLEKALIFLFLEGQSHREIAASLGISEGNARVRLARVKERLKQIIKKNGYEF